MERTTPERPLILTSGSAAFQLLADDDALVFVRLGNADDYDTDLILKKIPASKDGKNILSVPKARIESADCAWSDQGFVLALGWEGKRRRFYTEEPVSVERVRRMFAGTPLHMSGKGRPAATSSKKNAASRITAAKKPADSGKPERVISVTLAAASIILLLLRTVLRAIPGMETLARALAAGWMVIPLIWVPMQAKYGFSRLQSEFGAVATCLSCLLLFMLPELKPDSWLGLLPVILLSAAILIALWILPLRKLDATVVGVVIAAMVYAPGVALSLNDIPRHIVDSVPVTIEEISNEYTDGEWYYYVTVEQYGVDTKYEISRSEYNEIVSGSRAEVRRYAGLLGCITTDIIVTDEPYEADATAGTEPEETEPAYQEGI